MGLGLGVRMEDDEALARAIAASLEDQKQVSQGTGSGSQQKSEEDLVKGNELKKEGTEAKEDKGTKLSLEEREALMKAKLEELKRRKVEEEKVMERQRELERIRVGKETIQQKRILEDQERQRVLDFRKREKEENRRAKQAVMEQIARDKAERRSRMATTQSPSGNNERKKDKGDEQKKTNGIFVVKPISTQTKIRDKLVAMKKTYPEEKANTAFRTLNAYCKNLLKVPLEAKFRSIRTSNNAFQQRVACLEGGEGIQVLELVGFEKSGEFFNLGEDKYDKLVVEAACSELNNAISNPFFGAL